MRAAVYYNNEDIRIEEMPKPKIGHLGHEIAGQIEEVGVEVDRFEVGQRVFVSHHVPCDECRYCKAGYHTVCATLRSTNFDPGGFAEFVRVPEMNVRNGVYSLPEGITFEEGTFVEPLGCVIRGQRFAGMKPEHTLVVIGSGISGLMHIQLAHLSGVAKIIATDINEYRLKAARRFGADVAIHAREDVAERVRDVNGGRLADVVIVCTAALPAFEQAFESVDCAGTVLLFAPTAPDVKVPLPLYDVYFKSARIVFSYAAVDKDITQAIELLRSKKFRASDMITHRFGLSDIGKGFELVARAEDSIKVIIFPHK